MTSLDTVSPEAKGQTAAFILPLSVPVRPGHRKRPASPEASFFPSLQMPVPPKLACPGTQDVFMRACLSQPKAH